MGHQYDYAAHPIAPFGTRILTANPATTRASFEPHGELAYYLGPSLEHYRAYRIYVPATKAKRITDSCTWFPATVRMPGSNPAEIIDQAIRELTTAVNRRQRNRKGNLDKGMQQVVTKCMTAMEKVCTEYTCLTQ